VRKVFDYFLLGEAPGGAAGVVPGAADDESD
jgi:hypothetical protein